MAIEEVKNSESQQEQNAGNTAQTPAENAGASDTQAPDLNLNIETAEQPAAETPTEEPAQAPDPASSAEEDPMAELERLRKENAKLKEGGMSEEKILELVSDQVAAAMAKLSPGTQEAINETQQLVNEALDDMLPEPVMFFTHAYRSADFGYTKNNRAITPPGGEPIQFEPWQRYNRRNFAGKNRGVETVSISQFKTWSKETVQYMMQHPDFNITFFLNPRDASDVEVHLVDLMAKFNQQVRGMSDQAVIAACKEKRITIHSDIVVLRKQLIKHMAEDEERRVRSIQEEKAKKYAEKEKEYVDSADGVLSEEGRAMLNR